MSHDWFELSDKNLSFLASIGFTKDPEFGNLGTITLSGKWFCMQLWVRARNGVKDKLYNDFSTDSGTHCNLYCDINESAYGTPTEPEYFIGRNIVSEFKKRGYG
jgi:hypothetical protein